MEKQINQVLNDINIELPKLKKEFQSYLELNSLITDVDKIEEKYDNLLLNYGTAKMKEVVGLLSAIFYNLEMKGFDALHPLFAMCEKNGQWDIEVFYCKQILERYTDDSEETVIIRLKTYKKIFDTVVNNEDKINQINYLIQYLEYFLNKHFIIKNPKHKKDLTLIISDIYTSLFTINVTVLNDEKSALFFLKKAYDLRKELVEKGLISWETSNLIFILINIIGLYTKLVNDDEKDLSEFDISPVVEKDVLNQFKFLRTALENSVEFSKYFRYSNLKNYLHQLLTNIYILGYSEIQKKALKLLPVLNTLEYTLLIDFDLLSKNIHNYSFEEAEKRLNELKNTFDRLSNNLTKHKKEMIFYAYYSAVITVYSSFGKQEKLENLKTELENKSDKFENQFSIKIPLLKVYKELGNTDKAVNLATELKQKAIFSGRKSIEKIIDSIVEDI